MKELIERAFEIRNDLKYCAVGYDKYTCRQCAYLENGCRNELMLDATTVIERLIEEVSHG